MSEFKVYSELNRFGFIIWLKLMALNANIQQLCLYSTLFVSYVLDIDPWTGLFKH
jgi:hypothetical protein